MSTDISGVTDNFFPVAYGGFVDSLASTASAGATTVALTSLAEYSTGDTVVLCVNPGDAVLEAFFTGTVNSNSVENVKWVGGPGAAASHAAGAPVRDYVSAAGQSMMTKGIKQQHNDDGTHGGITATSVASSGAVSGTTVTGSGAGEFAGVTSTTTTSKYKDQSGNSVDVDPMRRNEGFQGYDFIQTGLNPSSASGLVVTIPAGTYYINGKRYTYAGGTKTLTASKDCYLDIDTSGTVTAVEVANGATVGMTLTANSIRFSKIVTGGASVSSYNNGDALTSCFDPLGNRIRRTNPYDKLLGYAEITSNATTTSGTFAQVTGLSVPIISPTLGDILITSWCSELSNSAIGNPALAIYDGTVPSGTQVSQLQIYSSASGAQHGGIGMRRQLRLSAGTSKTYNVGMKTNAGTATIVAAATYPAFVKVEIA